MTVFTAVAKRGQAAIAKYFHAAYLRIMKVRELITALGGDEIVAARYGVTESAVRWWKVRNRLPQQYEAPMTAWGAELGVRVPKEFFPPRATPGRKPKRARSGETQEASGGPGGRDGAAGAGRERPATAE